jgi:hypothetical protein
MRASLKTPFLVAAEVNRLTILGHIHAAHLPPHLGGYSF